MSQKILIPKPVKISQSNKSALKEILGEYSCVKRPPTYVQTKKVIEPVIPTWNREPSIRDIPDLI